MQLQLHKACTTDSASPEQREQLDSWRIFRFRRLSLVGSELVQAFQRKCLTLLGTFNFHMFITRLYRIAARFFCSLNQSVRLWGRTQGNRLDETCFRWKKAKINEVGIPATRYRIIQRNYCGFRC